MCWMLNQELYLRNNELEHLPPDVFRNMAKLSQLALSGNRLKTVDGNMFAHMPGKTATRPFYCPIFTETKDWLISVEVKMTWCQHDSFLTKVFVFWPLSDLKKLHLHDNLWLCDCNITSLVQWMGQTKATLSPRNALRCVSPPELRNKSFSSLQTDKLLCHT